MTGEIEIIPPGSAAAALKQMELVARPNISGASTDEQLVSVWLAGVRSPHTARLYNRSAMLLLAHLDKSGVGIVHATVRDVATFEDTLRHQKDKSRHTIMAAIRSLFRFAERTNYVFKSPAHIRPNRRPPNSMRERCLTEDEVWSLIDHAGSERNARLLRFLYGTGVRISELRWLTWKRLYIVAYEGRKVQVVTVLGKREIVREVAIPGFAELARPADAHDDDAIFPVEEAGLHPWPAIGESTIRWIVREAALLAGIRKAVSPHWFRHSACTHLQDHGVPPKDVQRLLGHASLDTTTGYSHGEFKGAPGDVLARRA